MNRAVIANSSSLNDSRRTEIEFGYDDDSVNINHGNVKDITDGIKYSDGNFINHRSSATFVVKSASGSSGGTHSLPLLCWILLLVLLLSIIVSIVVICCVCLKSRKSYVKSCAKEEPKSHIASHINGFSPTINSISAHQSIEMLPKYVASPAQSYSTQKLYQWCQQRDMQQHYKSLWAVNTTNSDQSTTISEKNEIPNAYKTRSLPSKNKQRPVSSIDDLDELYSKVNFSKKLRNRMTNNEAKIIAFCRSRSQNLSLSGGGGGSGGNNGSSSGGGPKEEAFVVYDERTAL